MEEQPCAYMHTGEYTQTNWLCKMTKQQWDSCYRRRTFVQLKRDSFDGFDGKVSKDMV